MRKISIILAVAFTLSAWAATIRPTAGGQVSTLATNVNETSLTIIGVIDARDFAYIGEKLTKLTTLNLQDATISAYESEKPVFGNQYVYHDNIVPIMALASHPALKTVTFPTTATGIGAGALAGCGNLTSVEFFSDLNVIEAYAFAGCTKISTVTIPASVTRLGDGAFLRCTALTKVNLGTTGTATSFEIGDEAFLGCSALNSFTFNSRMVAIGHRAFAGTAIKALDLSAYNNLKTIGDFAFAKAQLTSVIYPTSVTAIGKGALLYSSATSVKLPKNLSSVPDFAFAGSQQLSEITGLNSTNVDSIGDYSFYKVTKPTSLNLPYTTTHIGTMAMAGMTGLEMINILAKTVPTLDDDVWMGVDQPSVILYVPLTSVDDYNAAEQWKEFNIQPGFIPGDINNDGKVDVADVNMAVNHILKLPVGDPFIFDAGDINHNGIIDVEDINLMINIILRIQLYAPIVPNTSDFIKIDDFSIEPGESRTIEVKLESSVNCPALQCDIILPEGLSITSVDATAGTSNHTIITGEVNGALRVLCFSMEGNIIGHEGNVTPVLLLTVQADARLASLSTLNIENAFLTTPDCQALNCPATTAWVSTTTGVNDLSATDVRVWTQGNVLYIESNEPTTAQLISVNGTATQLAVMGGCNEYAGLNTGIYIVRIGNSSHKVVIR